MDEWLHCQTCGLKYRARVDGCPRCAKTAAEQPPPDLRDSIPESPVYEPPRYEGSGDARITEYATGDAVDTTGPFRLPWYLLGGTAVVVLLGAIVSPARPAIGLSLMGVGALFSVGASLWTLAVAWELGILWVVGSVIFPIVGLIALLRANNLRPLGLSVVATLMVFAGVGLAGADKIGVFKERARQRQEATALVRDPTREEYMAECVKKTAAFRCACETAALYDELGQEVRLRIINNQETPADTTRLNEAVRRSCKGSR